MRVIITGGTGLIGRALAQRLVGRNDEVYVLTRDVKGTTGLPSAVRLQTWNGQNSQGWGPLVDGSTAIVNLAGEGIANGRWTPSRKQRILESRVNAGVAVVDATRGAAVKPKVVVQASAVGYYGPHGHEAIIESSPPGPDFLARVCVEWERSSLAVESMGVRRAVIRTGVVLSMSGGALPRLLLPYRFFAGGPLGSGAQEFPWIHIDDEVEAIVRLIDDENAHWAFNLSAPQPLTNAEFGRVVGRVMGRPSLLPTPAVALKLAFGEMSTVLLDGQRAIPRHLLDLGFTFRYSDAESALSSLLR